MNVIKKVSKFLLQSNSQLLYSNNRKKLNFTTFLEHNPKFMSASRKSCNKMQTQLPNFFCVCNIRYIKIQCIVLRAVRLVYGYKPMSSNLRFVCISYVRIFTNIYVYVYMIIFSYKKNTRAMKLKMRVSIQPMCFL